MRKPTLYGYDTSTYTQIVQLVLEMKGVDYDFVRAADWSGYRKRIDCRDLNPFGMVPVFDHHDMRIFESIAIATYVDMAFEGPSLRPSDPVALARMHRLISIHDNHVRRPWVTIISAERDFVKLVGRETDEQAVAAALPDAMRAAEVLERLLGDRPRGQLDLADLYLAPATGFFAGTPEGGQVLRRNACLLRWWEQVRANPVVARRLDAVASNAPAGF